MPRPNRDLQRGAAVDRRTVLVGSAAVVAPLAQSDADAADADTDTERTAKSLQYRESEHVRQFYARCRF